MGLGIKMGGGGGAAATYAWLKTPLIDGVKDDTAAKYITSESPNAYLEYGVKGNYFYEKVPLRVVNGELRHYRSAQGQGTIAPNTFVQLVTESSIGEQHSETVTSYIKDCFELTENSGILLDYNSSKYYATEYRIGEDGGITTGVRVLIASGPSSYSTANIKGLKLSDTEFLITFRNASDRGALAVCSLVDGTISTGTAVQVGTIDAAKFGRSFIREDGSIFTLLNQGAKLYSVESMRENNTITVTAPETELGSTYAGIAAEQLADDLYVYFYEDSSDEPRVVPVYFVDKSATMGTSIDVGAFGEYTTGDLRRISSSEFALAFLDGSKASLLVGNVNDGVITVGTAVQSSASAFRYMTITQPEVGVLAHSYLQDLTSKFYYILDVYRIHADGTLTLLNTLKPFGDVSMDRLYSQVIVQSIGGKMLSAVDKGSTVESVVVDYGTKVVPATSAIEGITRTKAYENVRGDVWVLGG